MRRSFSPLAFLALTALAAFAASVRAPRALAGDVIDPVDAIEDRALQAESRAKFAEALAGFEEAMKAAVTQANAPGAEKDRERNLSVAEAILEKISTTTEAATKQGETEKFLEGLDPQQLGPVLSGEVDSIRAGLALGKGDVDSARKLSSSLGIVRDWWVVGPFDNEQGRSFAKAYPPEKSVDLAATYDGKDRQVAWRKVPVDAPLGQVDLDSLMRPNDQALAYAVCFVKSDVERSGALRLGSDEAVKAWWNGVEVLSRDVRRPLAWDQDVVGVAVAAGWNVLKLKVCDQTGAWAFRARLTAANGSRLDGVTVATTAEEAKEALAAAPKTGAAFEGQVAGGAKAFFDEAVKAPGGGRGARDWFHLGLLHLRRAYDSIKDRAAEEDLKHAREQEPGNAIYWSHYAEAASPRVEMVVEKEENRQRQAREKAVELDPLNAVVWRALASYYVDSVREPEKAEQAIRKALEVNPQWAEARLELARILEWRGLAVEAAKERAKVVEDEGTTASLEAAARAKAAALEGQGRQDEAEKAWEAVSRMDGADGGVFHRSANLLANAAKREKALAALDRAIAVNPYDARAWQRRAEFLEGGGDLLGAEKALTKALEIAPEDENLLQAVGRVRWKAGRKDEALASFREALRINPRLLPLERYVEILDPSAAPFEDDYRIDVAPYVKKAATWKNEENDGYVVLLDHTVTRVNVNGTSSSYAHWAAKVLTKVGQRSLARIPPPGGWGATMRWKAARLLKADGSVVEGKRSEGGVDFGTPDLGDVVEIETRTDQRSQGFFGDYFGTVEFFADRAPMLESRFTLITPKERAFYTHQRNFDAKPEVGTTADGKWDVRTWSRTDAPKVKPESSMPGPMEIYPQVQVSTFQDWNAFGKWWWSLIRDQHILSDDMRAKVKDLVKDKATQEEKVRAIYDFVTTDVTYQAWPAGIHGWKPYAATAIFEKKEGDCKDKAILTNTLLSAIGVQGYPVLIMGDNTRDDEDMTLPLVNHFNHCIAYVPDVDGHGKAMFLDGTAQYHSIYLPPGMDRGAKVVVMKPDGADLLTIPFGTSEDTGLDQAWDVTVDEKGDADLKAELTWRGDFAVEARRLFSVEGQRSLLLKQFIAGLFGGGTLGTIDFDDLKDLSKPSTSFRVTAKVPGFAKAAGESRTLQTQFLERLLGGRLMMLGQRPEREHDLLLTMLSLKVKVTYHLPAGWTVEAPPQDADVKGDGFAFTSKATSTSEASGATLTLAREIAFTSHRVKVAQYASFREALSKTQGLLPLSWKVKPAAAPTPPAPPEAPPTAPKTPPAGPPMPTPTPPAMDGDAK